MSTWRLLVAALLFCGACSDGVGTPCETSSDCGKNLICRLTADATPEKGGTCEDNVAPDQAVARDLESTDDLFDAAVTAQRDTAVPMPADLSEHD